MPGRLEILSQEFEQNMIIPSYGLNRAAWSISHAMPKQADTLNPILQNHTKALENKIKRLEKDKKYSDFYIYGMAHI